MGVVLQWRQLKMSVRFYIPEVISNFDSKILSVLFFFLMYITIRLSY